jgi:hypothetical protein
MSRIPVRRGKPQLNVVSRRNYTFSESVQAYWFLRQLRNRSRMMGCPQCLDYINAMVHNIAIMLGFMWAEIQAIENTKRKEAA